MLYILFIVMQRKRPSLVQMMGLQSRSRASARTKVATKWLAKVKKGQVAPKGNILPQTRDTDEFNRLGSSQGGEIQLG